MDRKPPGYHEDVALFCEALSYTQSATGFSARLVEKDYFGSLILSELLAVTSPPWVFKGGTCLSKVHSDFYRLSEDLDFAYSVPLDAPRSQRRMTIEPLKLRYRSAVTGQDEAIKVEFSIREPILEPVEFLPALTRREPAIRDFFDLDHAVRSGRLNAADTHLLELLRQKLAVRGNASIDVSDAKREVRDRQVQAQLRPVLREADFAEFDLERAFETVAMIARTLA
jgi:hypothetical protein